MNHDDPKDAAAIQAILGERRHASVRTPTAEDEANPHPTTCVWELTLACDLGCRHCGSRAGDARSDELSLEECLDVAQQLCDNGVREVVLIGGEFYMREGWDQIAAHMSARGVAVTVVTGARNLTEDVVARAEAAGIQAISISIDGLEKTHDALRGARGSWRAAVDAMERVAKTSIRPGNNTQLNRLSIPELPALAKFLVDMGCKAWQLQLTTPMGHASDRPDLLLQPYDYLEVFPLMVWLKQTMLAPAGCQLFLGNNIGYFGPYERFLRYGGIQGGHWNGCPAGAWGVSIESDGKVKGCPSLPSHPYTGGNVREADIGTIYRTSPELTEIRKRTRDDLWGYCKTCYYGDVCKGGCNWVSTTLLGRSGNNPYCIHRALDFESRGLRERVVKVESAPGLPYDYGRYEIIVEPMPSASEPVIVGVPLATIQGLDASQPGVWSRDQLAAKLRLPR